MDTSCTQQFYMHYDQNIPLPFKKLISTDTAYFPKDWGMLNYSEILSLSKIFPERMSKSREKNDWTSFKYCLV